MSDGSAGLATIPELDPAEFGRWSRGNGIDIPDDVAVTRVGIGQSNLTYLLTAGDVRWVLRRPPVGNLLASAHDVVREARILSLRFGLDDQSPKTLNEIGEIVGLSRERVRQLESHALNKLKEALTSGKMPADS